MSISHWGMFFGFYYPEEIGNGVCKALYRSCTPEGLGW